MRDEIDVELKLPKLFNFLKFTGGRWSYVVFAGISFAINLVFFGFGNEIRGPLIELFFPVSQNRFIVWNTLGIETIVVVSQLLLIPVALFVLLYVVSRRIDRTNYKLAAPILLGSGIAGAETGLWVGLQICSGFCPPYGFVGLLLGGPSSFFIVSATAPSLFLIMNAIPSGIYTLFVGICALTIAQLRKNRRQQDIHPTSKSS